MDNNVAAPNGEAAPLTNTEQASAPVPAETSATPALTPAQVAEYLGTTPDMLEQYQKFTSGNGGFDKAFANMKKALNTRQADLQPQAQIHQPNPLTDVSQAPQPMVQPQQSAPQPIQGGITQEEFAIQQYFTSLAGQEQYRNIAEQMRSGEVLKEMAKFDIQPMVNGVFNDQKVRNFLDLYSKSVPAAEPAAPVTNTPTVEYVQVPETITTMAEAMKVLQQDQQMRALGQPGHPRAKEANEFFDGVLNAQQSRGKREHKTLEQPQAK